MGETDLTPENVGELFGKTRTEPEAEPSPAQEREERVLDDVADLLRPTPGDRAVIERLHGIEREAESE